MGQAEVATRAVLLGEPLPVELMNTIVASRGTVYDALSNDTEVAAWLRAISERLRHEAGAVLESATLDETAVHPAAGRLRKLRDALRRLAAETTGSPWPRDVSAIPARQDAIDTLNALAPTWPELAWPAGEDPVRTFRTAGTPVDLAISVIAHQAVELFASPLRDQLRPCLAPGCVLYFLKNHPRREWCAPACGNRARVARHYQRHHTANHSTGQVQQPQP
jgi:predicted RNA-binding Zn ribbon-like protein